MCFQNLRGDLICAGDGDAHKNSMGEILSSLSEGHFESIFGSFRICKNPWVVRFGARQMIGCLRTGREGPRGLEA